MMELFAGNVLIKKANGCMEKLSADALDLINRLQAENENYKQIAEHQQSVTMYRGFEIKRLKEEIERLKAKCENTQVGYNFLKADFEETEKRNRDLVRAFQSYKSEAYKEFAELLFKKAERKNHKTEEYHYVLADDIVDLLKELVGEDK